MTYFHIDVRNPRTHIRDDKALYTDYEINVQTNNMAFCKSSSKIRRRYSEFLWLRYRLCFLYGSDRNIPQLPGRCLFGRFKKIFIVKRKEGLLRFLKEITSDPIYLSDKATHLFLQTNLSVKSMILKLSRDDSDDELNDLLHSYSLYSNCAQNVGMAINSNSGNFVSTNNTSSNCENKNHYFDDEDSGYINSSSMEEEGCLQTSGHNMNCCTFNSLTNETGCCFKNAYIENSCPTSVATSTNSKFDHANNNFKPYVVYYDADDETDDEETNDDVELFIPCPILPSKCKVPIERALNILHKSFENSKIRKEQADSDDEFNPLEYVIVDSDGPW